MTTVELLRGKDGSFRFFGAAKRLKEAARSRSKPLTRHLADHAYTLAGFGCISAASFVHSVFTGLLVTGILLLVFEFKVGD